MIFACAKFFLRKGLNLRVAWHQYMYDEAMGSPLSILHYIPTQGAEFGT
jgi:hypothetical protein